MFHTLQVLPSRPPVRTSASSTHAPPPPTTAPERATFVVDERQHLGRVLQVPHHLPQAVERGPLGEHAELVGHQVLGAHVGVACGEIGGDWGDWGFGDN